MVAEADIKRIKAHSASMRLEEDFFAVDILVWEDKLAVAKQTLQRSKPLNAQMASCMSKKDQNSKEVAHLEARLLGLDQQGDQVALELATANLALAEHEAEFKRLASHLSEEQPLPAPTQEEAASSRVNGPACGQSLSPDVRELS